YNPPRPPRRPHRPGPRPPAPADSRTARPAPPGPPTPAARARRAPPPHPRPRLYPLAAGPLTIGPAQAMVVIPVQQPRDPFGFLSGGSGRQVALQSDSQHVQVFPLPKPDPDGFSGAVGSFDARWTSDRRRTALDTPFTIVLQLR